MRGAVAQRLNAHRRRRVADRLEQARRRRPDARLRAVTDAYRGRALEHPGQYPLLLAGGLARGDQPSEIATASQRAMQHILVALRDLAAARPAPALKLPRELNAQLRSWPHDRGAGDDLPRWLLWLAIVTWQRLHGHIAPSSKAYARRWASAPTPCTEPRWTRSSPTRSRQMDSGCRRKFLGLP